MKGEIRREEILSRLAMAEKPVSAGSLSGEFGVSRQIIVKDIARLRDEGAKILAYARGYVLENKGRPSRVFKIFHSDEDVEKELNLIVDMGGAVEDVFVYHKAYNKVTAPMNIRTRKDVEKFLDSIATGKSSLLKNVTSGYHYHTVSADSFETLKNIEDKLWEKGFLAKLREYEPAELKIGG
ncbi:MAG: transcription repressor NadR [Clostridia bacterium]|nr:transcription repressor NadR [Clostridia bacterium]